MNDFRCSECKKLLGKIEGKAEIQCPRCKTMNRKLDGMRHDTIIKDKDEQSVMVYDVWTKEVVHLEEGREPSPIWGTGYIVERMSKEEIRKRYPTK